MRILTRADFDGLACSVLLTDIGLMDNWLFVHPKDVQDGKITATKDDIVCNVPYIPGCGYWFDHHLSEHERLNMDMEFQGASKEADSAARVIWEYFGGHDKFGYRFDEMLHYVDKMDSGQLTVEEIEDPQGWILLGFIMDPRTGLGRYRFFRISNYQLMENLIEYCRTLPIEEILAKPDVDERIELYFDRQHQYRHMLEQTATQQGNVLVVDLRELEEIAPGNRFTMYSMFPDCNVSIQVMWGRQKQNVVFAVGRSITNRSSTVDIGSLLLKYGGGGHPQVGTCQTPEEDADQVLVELVNALLDDTVPLE
jgi:nanoRNase/pAp phosphatase (c-di-AMP/oligoRNAs hydrolase)